MSIITLPFAMLELLFTGEVNTFNFFENLNYSVFLDFYYDFKNDILDNSLYAFKIPLFIMEYSVESMGAFISSIFTFLLDNSLLSMDNSKEFRSNGLSSSY